MYNRGLFLLCEGFLWMHDKALNIYSQYGEDGLVSALMEKIEPTNRYCVDVGAHDGLFFSNTRNLIEQGWTALLVEANEQGYKNLVSNSQEYIDSGQVKTVNCKADVMSPDRTLDELLDEAGAPEEPDYMSIDIDGQEWYVWNSMLKYWPKVMMVEVQTYPNEDKGRVPVRDTEENQQCGLSQLVHLAQSKGYCTVARTYSNAIFIRYDFLEKAYQERTN